MPVGSQITSGQMDNILTSLTIGTRDIMRQIFNVNRSVNGGGAGLAYLQTIGYSNAANPGNPGGISDAQWAFNIISFLNTISGVYFGTATQPAVNDYDTELAPVWGGQVLT